MSYQDELTGLEEHLRDELSAFDESADQFFMRREAEEDARKEHAMYLWELAEEIRMAGFPCIDLWYSKAVNHGTVSTECKPDTCPF
jgi:hypothetical protein